MSKNINIEKKRKVLIDLRYLGIAHGFGELCNYYGNYIMEHPEKVENLDITLLVPKEYIGRFGPSVTYLQKRSIYKIFPQLLPYFDVWHNTTQQAKFCSNKKKTKKILSIHDLNFIYEKNREKSLQDLDKTQDYIDRADFITFISKFTEQEVRNNLKIENKPSLINYVGIKDLRKETVKKPNFLLVSDKPFLFTISGISKKKNTHVLLDMMKLLPQYNLYICGNNNNAYGESIIKRIKDENISNIIMPGQISFEEKVWMYQNCYGFVFPSLFEGFGMPIIEAMQFGKPVFSSKCTSLPEVGNKYALYFNSFDPEDMSNQIINQIDSFYLDTDKISEQIDYSLSYTLERHMDTYINLYKTI